MNETHRGKRERWTKRRFKEMSRSARLVVDEACCDKGALQVLSRFRVDPLEPGHAAHRNSSPDKDRVAGNDGPRLADHLLVY
jgi:hypothetical protein